MLRGVYHDEIADPGGVRWRSGWRPNAIVESCDRLLASLLKRAEGMEGILFWAVGSGEPGWDAAPPAALPTTTRLAREIARLGLSPAQMSFLDGTGAPSDSPTDHLEVTVEIRGDELAPDGFVSLREFGLFGGDASEEADTGLLVDYVVHPRIDLGPGFVLRRRLRLSFASRRSAGGTPGAFGAALPVAEIDGVGETFGAALLARGVTTVGALAQMDPRAPVADVPPVRLIEFRTKARMVLGLQLDPAPLVPLSQHSLSGLLLSQPRDVASAAGGEITIEEAARLQDALAPLQVALDEESLQRLTLGEVLRA